MENCEGGLQEKPSFSNKEFGELIKEEIGRMRNFLGTLYKQLGMCSLAQIGKSSVSHTLRASDLSLADF